MRSSVWSSDVFSADLRPVVSPAPVRAQVMKADRFTFRFMAFSPLFGPLDRAGCLELAQRLLKSEPFCLILRPAKRTKCATPHVSSSEERGVAEECVSTCRYWWSMYHEKKQQIR